MMNRFAKPKRIKNTPPSRTRPSSASKISIPQVSSSSSSSSVTSTSSSLSIVDHMRYDFGLDEFFTSSAELISKSSSARIRSKYLRKAASPAENGKCNNVSELEAESASAIIKTFISPPEVSRSRLSEAEDDEQVAAANDSIATTAANSDLIVTSSNIIIRKDSSDDQKPQDESESQNETLANAFAAAARSFSAAAGAREESPSSKSAEADNGKTMNPTKDSDPADMKVQAETSEKQKDTEEEKKDTATVTEGKAEDVKDDKSQSEEKAKEAAVDGAADARTEEAKKDATKREGKDDEKDKAAPEEIQEETTGRKQETEKDDKDDKDDKEESRTEAAAAAKLKISTELARSRTSPMLFGAIGAINGPERISLSVLKELKASGGTAAATTAGGVKGLPSGAMAAHLNLINEMKSGKLALRSSKSTASGSSSGTSDSKLTKSRTQADIGGSK